MAAEVEPHLIEHPRKLGQLVVPGERGPGAEIARAHPHRARAQRRDRTRDRSHEVRPDARGHEDRERETADHGDASAGADPLCAPLRAITRGLERSVELLVQRHHLLDGTFGHLVEFRDPRPRVAEDRRDNDVSESAVALGDERRDLVGAALVLAAPHLAAQVHRRGLRRSRHLLVVREVRAVPLEQRVGLVDVLLARHRRGVVARMLHMVEARHLLLGLADACQRQDHHHQGQGEQQQHRGERHDDAARRGPPCPGSARRCHTDTVPLLPTLRPGPGSRRRRGRRSWCRPRRARGDAR